MMPPGVGPEVGPVIRTRDRLKMMMLNGEKFLGDKEKLAKNAELPEVNGGSAEAAEGAEEETEEDREREARIQKELKAFRLHCYEPETYWEDGILKYHPSRWSSEQPDYAGFGFITNCGHGVSAEFCANLRAQFIYTARLKEKEKKMKLLSLPGQPSFSRVDLYAIVYDYLDKNGLETLALEFLPQRTMEYPFMVNSRGHILDTLASHLRRRKEKKAEKKQSKKKQVKKITRTPVIDSLIQSIELAIENGNTDFVRGPRNQKIREEKSKPELEPEPQVVIDDDAYEDIIFPKFQDRTFKFTEEWCYYYYN